MKIAVRSCSTVFVSLVSLGLCTGSAYADNFNRIASFPVNHNLPSDVDPLTETSAEIVAVSTDGTLLSYSDSPLNAIGFIDISNPAKPEAAGIFQLDGEPTSVAMAGRNVFTTVNTSSNFIDTSGQLMLIDADEKKLLATCELGGQPDSIALSPDQTILAVAIENERDEDLNDGLIPQMPAGFVSIFPIKDGMPDCSGVVEVALSGLAEIAPDDPEPEFVDINSNNFIAVTLQENNHVVVIDGLSGKVVSNFSAGAVDLDNVDVLEEFSLTFDGSQPARKREPDTIKWLGTDRLVTANEGDYEGGSRGFTVFDVSGKVLYESGMSFEYEVAMAGHYPEKRSGNKGVEPEGLEVANFRDTDYIFVQSERGSVIGVYTDTGSGPEFQQLLPSGIGPEGAVAIPSRDLLVSSNEVDLGADNGARSHVMLYQLSDGPATYPHLVSQMVDGKPIGWGALSGLAADPSQANRLYAVSDSFYKMMPSIFTIDASTRPAKIVNKTIVNRAGIPAQKLDLEGIVADGDGGFWLASEGRADRLIANALYHVDADGEIQQEVGLPIYLRAVQKRFGFEGLTSTGTGDDYTLWIPIQREWLDDDKGFTKILSYRPADGSWGAVRYPLDPVEKGWVGLSSVHSDGQRLYIVERDNQSGENAAIKRLYQIDIPTAADMRSGGKLPLVQKTLVHDFLPDMQQSNGFVLDKLEGFAIDVAGNAFAVTDNDGVDDHSGETLFFSIGNLTATQQ